MVAEYGKRAEFEPARGPLFVVSMWRGGSSLLYALLNKHEQVALMFEADLVLLRPVFLKPEGMRDWAERWEFWNRALSRHGLDGNEFAGVVPEFRRVLEAVHKEYARRKGAVIWGDKSPNYHDQLVRMAEEFPGARFIIVWRSPMETIGATMRAAAAGSGYFRKRGMALRSLLGYRLFKRQCRQIIAAGAAVHQLHYEDLVNDTAGVMRRVCEFLEIPYSDHLCTLEGADRSAVYAGGHHNLLRRDVVDSGPRQDVLEPVLRQRIERYVTWWHESDAGQAKDDCSSGVPRPVEMRLDQIRYRLCRALDELIRVAFCFLPIPLLRRYRKAKERAQEADVKRESRRRDSGLGIGRTAAVRVATKIGREAGFTGNGHE